jgi:hypothetical protein
MAFQLVKLVDPIRITVTGDGLPEGVNTGDIIRWNAISGGWEVIEEPFELSEIKLTPKASSDGAEGTVFYSNVDKKLYVGVE